MAFDTLFNEWIGAIVASSNPGDNIEAYFFGLFEDEEGYTLYLIGSGNYNEENGDWACPVDMTEDGPVYDFMPEEAYLDLPEDEFSDLEWDAVTDIIVEKLDEYCQSDAFAKSFFNKAKVIATGFDEGDMIIIKS